MPTGRRAGVISLGCSKNLVDTEYLMGVLRGAGWTFVPRADSADLLLVNTCSFIDNAVEESREAIREALVRKASSGGVRVVVAGCLVSRFGHRLEKEYPGVDHFLMPGRISRLGELLRGAERGERFARGSRRFCPPAHQERARTTGPWAYLKISDGCDNSCRYCLIPRIRGPQRSRPAAAVIGEARRLLEEGVREINLVGQDITRWRGKGDEGLVDLLGSLASLEGDYRLRLLYLHPARVTDELIGLMAGNPRVWPYADIPIQHASDRVLRAMNRPYTRRRLSRLYDTLRGRIPGVALRTTVMVGYPGEGRRDFLSLLRFLGDHPFENLGAFIFSPQEGTRAALLDGRVDPAEAEERYRLLMTLQTGLARGLWASRKGQEAEALLIAPAEGRQAWEGRAMWQAPEVDGMLAASGKGSPGALVRVRITGHGSYDLEGKICP